LKETAGIRDPGSGIRGSRFAARDSLGHDSTIRGFTDEGSTDEGFTDEGFTISDQWLAIQLPPAAISLITAIRASPDRVHPKHLGTASLTDHRVVRRVPLWRAGRWRRGRGRGL